MTQANQENAVQRVAITIYPLVFAVLALISTSTRGEEGDSKPISFIREVAPILVGKCQGCHGPDGKGNQAMAKALQANIPDLTSKEIAKIPSAEILEALSKGKGKMPATTGLSEKELKELIGYVKGMAKGK